MRGPHTNPRVPGHYDEEFTMIDTPSRRNIYYADFSKMRAIWCCQVRADDGYERSAHIIAIFSENTKKFCCS